MGREWVLNKTADEACVFLDPQGLCRIHSKYGEAAKPLACRIFPFSVRPTRRGWQASFRFDCPSSTSSKGQPLSRHTSWLRELATHLEQRDEGEEIIAELEPGLVATEAETDLLVERFCRWLQSDDQPVMQRLIGAARLTGTLHLARFEKVRGPRLGDLLDVLFQTLPGENREPLDPATRRQRGLLRQLAFAHAEHVSHAEARSGKLSKLRKRWQQLRFARRFLRGKGAVPSLRGFPNGRGVRFAVVEGVGAAGDGYREIEDLLIRYAVARLQGRSCFGEGYYGWPIVPGLAALWLSLSAAGWLARYQAALSGRTFLSFDDVAFAIGVVDRAATRLPALGGASERIRAAYLLRDLGVARLLRDYAFVAG
jgi:lysine-N-methylase